MTSGTTKLMAISSREEGRIGDSEDCWRRSLPEFLRFLDGATARRVLGCRMTAWKKSTGEGSIYRSNRTGANLTYLFVASEKSEGVQMDMVTVCIVIKGLHK